MLEQTVEARLKRAVEAEGGLCLKWVCPGHDGVPDRIIIHKNVYLFVELKRPGGKPRKLQEYWHEKLKRYGAQVFVVDGDEGIQEVMGYLREAVMHDE